MEAKSLNLVTSKNKIRIKYSMLLAKGSYDSGKLIGYVFSPKYKINFNIPNLNKTNDYNLVLNFKGYVDDYLNIYLNDNKIISKHKGGWTLCEDYNNIKCSPILSPLKISLNNLNLESINNIISFEAENVYQEVGQVWLKLDEVKVEISWITN
ncbi:hypothetical protein FPD46_03815 [Campylobacter peloridis]|uniref:Uncharacterized protein n=2 Tax=Campylobacter TaxID=194 RepID=A0A5C7DXJ6_9BACT|nr:hypothetical protein [Campylobacter peloridis]TXE82928.1 hypothetical protein FPD46_03815 [Campylobacter peloridis]